MVQINEADSAAHTPHRLRFSTSKSSGSSYSDVRERFARRQQRKHEERMNNAIQSSRLQNETVTLRRSSAFISPIIQANLKRSRETSNQSSVISPTSVTHSIPREPQVPIPVGADKVENKTPDIDDEEVTALRPILCATSVVRNENAPPLMRRMQEHGSLLDRVMSMSSCTKESDNASTLENRKVLAIQHPTKEKHQISDALVVGETTKLACKAGASTRKFAYQAFVDAGLLVGRTVTDCAVFSKDVYRLNSSTAHRQRGDDSDFFLHETGSHAGMNEEEVLSATLPYDSLKQSRSPDQVFGIDYSDAFRHAPPQKYNFEIALDASDFAQLLIHAHGKDSLFLGESAKSKTYGDSFRSEFKGETSERISDECEVARRSLTEAFQVQREFPTGVGKEPDATDAIKELRLPSALHLKHDVVPQPGMSTLPGQSDGKLDYKNASREDLSDNLPDMERETRRPTRNYPTRTEQTPIYGEMRPKPGKDTQINDNRCKQNTTAKVPMELSSLRSEVVNLQAQIAEARAARFAIETEKVQAMLDRERYHREVDELKSQVSKIEQQERETRDQLENNAHAREEESRKLRMELDEVRSFLEKKIIERERIASLRRDAYTHLNEFNELKYINERKFHEGDDEKKKLKAEINSMNEVLLMKHAGIVNQAASHLERTKHIESEINQTKEITRRLKLRILETGDF